MSRKFGARRVTTPRTGCSFSENNGEVTKVVLILDTNFLTSPYPGPKVVTQPTSNFFFCYSVPVINISLLAIYIISNTAKDNQKLSKNYTFRLTETLKDSDQSLFF